MSRIIDVSQYQGQPSWRKLAHAGVTGAYIRTALIDKATRSFTIDTEWLRNITGARAEGIVAGGYFYARAGAMPAKEQAQRFLRLAAPRAGDLPPALDLEDHDGLAPAALAKWSREFMSWLAEGLIDLGLDGLPVFYTMPGFSSRLGENHGLDRYPLWVAHVKDSAGNPRQAPPGLPSGFTRWALHQYSWTGRVDGIAGNVDEDRLPPGKTLESLDLDVTLPTPTPTRGDWPKPLPKWFWKWARWRLGEGEFKGKVASPSLRPATAPKKIPAWAWARLEALVAQRAGERVEPEDPKPPKPPPKPKPKPPSKHKQLMASRRELANVWLEIARWPERGHYSQARKAQHTVDNVTVADVRQGEHWSGDCSSTVGDWGPHLAGLAPAPHGPWTNTTWIQREWIEVSTPALGDAVLYRGHVVGIVGFRGGKVSKDLDNIYVFSHGSESGPYGYPLGELTAGYRPDDFLGFFRHPSLV